MLDIDKVIVLGNDEKYLILDKVSNNDEEYYYIAKINDSNTDIENNYKLITIQNDDGKRIMVEVTGEEKLREILPLFSNQL